MGKDSVVAAGIIAIVLWFAACSPSTSTRAANAPVTTSAAVGEKFLVSPPLSPPTPTAAPEKFVVPAGRPIRVRTTTALTTQTARPGDQFLATLAEPLSAGPVVIAPRGARVMGAVVQSDPGGRVKGVAHLTLRLTRVDLPDGESASIETGSVTRQAHTTRKKDAVKIGIGSGIGAAIGAIAGGGKGAGIGAAAGAGAGTGVVLATHGDPAEVPAESLLTFALARPLAISR